MRRTLLVVVFAGVAAVIAAAAPVLTLDPTGGKITGGLGSTVGWGFTITNTSDYLVVTGSSFSPSSSLYGTYTDYVGNGPLLVVGPSPESTSVSESFDSGLQTGVGGFTVFSTDPVGTKITGSVQVDYSLFSEDPNGPNFDPGTSLLVSDGALAAPVTITVTPEPALSVFVGAGLAGLLIHAVRKKLIV